MSDPQILCTLRRKKNEIESVIAAYREKIAEAERDLSAVAATLRLFELGDQHEQFPAHLALGRFFRRGEILGVCKAALAADGPLDTRELALRVIRAKGLDEGDKVLRKTVAYRVVQALTMAAKRGKVGDEGRSKGVRVWRA